MAGFDKTAINARGIEVGLTLSQITPTIRMMIWDMMLKEKSMADDALTPEDFAAAKAFLIDAVAALNAAVKPVT